MPDIPKPGKKRGRPLTCECGKCTKCLTRKRVHKFLAKQKSETRLTDYDEYMRRVNDKLQAIKDSLG